jgi:polar amino acid transport system substrate-binding protein
MGKINEALIALAETDYKTVAETYGLTSELLVTKDTVNPYANATDSSWTELVASKKLVIGYTVFAPIAFPDRDGEGAQLIGFDIDLAKKVVDYLNAKYNTEIEVEFTKIEWATKEAKLENGDLDLVWNGMTITEERLNAMTISVPYLANKQVAVVAKADAEKYAATTLAEFGEKVKDAIITVEKGSAGEALVVEIPEE